MVQVFPRTLWYCDRRISDLDYLVDSGTVDLGTSWGRTGTGTLVRLHVSSFDGLSTDHTTRTRVNPVCQPTERCGCVRTVGQVDIEA